MTDPILTITAEDLGGRVRLTIEDWHGCKAERYAVDEAVFLAKEILEVWKKERGENAEP